MEFHQSLWLNKMYMHTHTYSLFFSLWFCILVVLNSAWINTDIEVFLCYADLRSFRYSWLILRGSIDEFYDSSAFSFLKSFNRDLYSSYSSVDSNQQWRSDVGYPSVFCEYHWLIEKLAWPERVEQSYVGKTKLDAGRRKAKWGEVMELLVETDMVELC